MDLRGLKNPAMRDLCKLLEEKAILGVDLRRL